MTGETDLGTLLGSLAPELIAGEFVFCTFPEARYGDHAALQPVVSVAEAEGLTLVIPRETADAHKIEYASAYRCIRLNVHSSLGAVGLTAAFSAALAKHDISTNVVAGHFHDHIFVKSDRADEALAALLALSRTPL